MVETRRKRAPLGDITNNKSNRSSSSKKAKFSKRESEPKASTQGGNSRTLRRSKRFSDPTIQEDGKLAGENSSCEELIDLSIFDEDVDQIERPHIPHEITILLPPGVEDIDKDDRKDALCNPDYIESYFQHLRIKEESLQPSEYIGSVQSDMRPNMRGILVDWLVEVADEYKLNPKTMYLGINLIDRSLSQFPVVRSKLQLLGCAAMLLAAKFEEIYAPSVDDFVYISDNTYTKEQILTMEQKITNYLNFQIDGVTPFHFLRRFLKASKANEKETSYVHYISELMMQDYQFVKYPASMQAAACINLARQTIYGRYKAPWSAQLEFYTGYSPRTLEDIVRKLRAVVQSSHSSTLKAVREKYAKANQNFASKITCLREADLEF